MTRRQKHVLFGTLMAIGLLGGQELLFRALFPLPDVAGFNRISFQMLAGAHPRLRETLKRGLVYDQLLLQSRSDGFSEIHRLNLYGFRGPDFSIASPRGRRRVLVIGDSVTEGQGAPEELTISHALATLSGARGQRDEVLNLGVIASSLPQETRLVRDAVSLLEPGVVVLVVYANDLPCPAYTSDLDQAAPRFPRREAARWVPRLVELMGRAMQGAPIYRSWPHTPLPFFAPVPDPSNPWTRSHDRPAGLDPALHAAMVAGTINPWLNEQAAAIPGMLSHDFRSGGSPLRFLQRMQEICAARSVAFLVAYVPFCGTVGPHYADSLVKLGMARETAVALCQDPLYLRQSQHLAAVCKVLGLRFVDATGAMVDAERAGSHQFWEFDSHPRPAGYATIAGRIHKALQEWDR